MHTTSEKKRGARVSFLTRAVLAAGLAAALGLGCGGEGGGGGRASGGTDTVGGSWGADGAASFDVGYGGWHGGGGGGDTAGADAGGWWGPGADVPGAPDSSGGGPATCDPPCADGQQCTNGWCVEDGCVPDCGGRQCGPDGCGGACGWCSGQASCQEGACVEVAGCTPQCAGQMVGADDGCGGVCSGGGFGIGLKPGGAQDVGYFRRLVADGQVPTPDLFPIEGFLNEHDTPLPPPDYDQFVTLHAFLGLFYDSAEEEPLLAMQIGMNSGIDPAEIAASHFNLVVVVDTSGSMGDQQKIEFVREGLLIMLGSLDENDLLSIVTYDNSARVAMSPVHVTAANLPEIADVIEGLTPGGSTNLYAGMELGYETAMRNITDSEAIHRIMLLSDGNITAGVNDMGTILGTSGQYNNEGIGITTIGVGLDFNQELMYRLANQGNGNFYFLDDGDKLIDVFRHEIEYLLTPVAENLKISFHLPPGFFVEDIYGFEFAEQDGDWVLLGPSPQYTVGGEPPDPGGGGNGGNVAVSTLFASPKNGLLMVKLGTAAWDVFSAWEAMDFATISYSYDLVTKGTTEGNEKTVAMGSLSYFEADDPDSGLAYFTGPTMQRNYCILRAGLAIREACERFHFEPADVSGAVVELSDAMTFCEAANFHLDSPDPAITEDVAFMRQVLQNMCDQVDCVLSQ